MKSVLLLIPVVGLAGFLLLRRGDTIVTATPQKEERRPEPHFINTVTSIETSRHPVSRDSDHKVQQVTGRIVTPNRRGEITAGLESYPIEEVDDQWVKSLQISAASRKILLSGLLMRKAVTATSPKDLPFIAENFAGELRSQKEEFLADLPKILSREDVNPERAAALLSATAQLPPNESEEIRTFASQIIDPNSERSKKNPPLTNDTFKDAAISYVLSSSDRGAALRELERLATPRNPVRSQILELIRDHYLLTDPK